MDDLNKLIEKADQLALQARAAALAGDHKRAAELRAEFEAIYDSVIDALTPVGYAYIQDRALESQEEARLLERAASPVGRERAGVKAKSRG